LAYKRYVHKKGKRHGPYYYKNVRDESGRVRSIYLGKVTSGGKKSLEVAIVFLTVLLIIISALFFIQNRNLVLSKIAAEEAKVPFEVDQILIKVLVKEKESIEKELRIMNIHEDEQAMRIETKEISHLVDVLDREFTIKPGQTKIVRLNFSSFDAVQKNEQAPGVYIGKIAAKTDSYEKEVPVVIEIESRNVLFDMNLNPIARDRTVTQGSSTTFEIRVFNLQSIESFNIDMDFFVKDINGNTIVSESESVVVQTQASFFKTLKIPEKLKTGNYVFVAQASLGNSVGTASYLFEVEEIAEERQFSRFLAFCRNDPLCWALSIIVLLLLFAVGAYSYFFIGVFIYKKLFGVSIPSSRKIDFMVEKKKENILVKSFQDVASWWGKSREASLRRKLKEDDLRLQIKEKESKLKDEKLLDKESSEIVVECRKLIEKGYKAIERNNIGKAQKAYVKLMDRYIDLPGKIKVEIFKDINSFYKNMLLKKQQLERYEGESKRKEEEGKRRIELEKKIQEELEEKRKKAAKDRKEKLKEDLKKGRKKYLFDFFHSIGLARTEQERQDIARRKEEIRKFKELEFQKKLEEKGKRGEGKFRGELEEKAEEQKELEEEKRTTQELEEQRKKELEKKKQEEKRKQEELKRKEQESKKLEEEKRRQEELKKKQEEENKKKEEERKKREDEKIAKQKEKEARSKNIHGLKDLVGEKEADINKLRAKIAEAYSANKAIAKEILDIEKDIYGLNNEKKTLYGMYNESVAGRKELAKEHESRIAEWKEKHEAKLREKEDIKKAIKQEYENELKELENELGKLSDKERKEEEKWKKIELKAKYKLEEHEREKSVNEDIKSQLEEKKEMEHEYNNKKQSLGKGIVGNEILQKQKELNEHIREHEKGIENLKEKIDENVKASERYGNEIEKLVKEKEKAEEKLLEARKEAGGLGYIASIFMPKGKKEAEKPAKQIEAGEKALQKKAMEIKAKIAEPKHEITKEEVEKEEAKEEEEKKELQNTLRKLQITAKQIEHKENIIEKLAREKEERGKKIEEKKPGIFDKPIKGVEEKAKAREQTEKEKEHIQIKRKLANKSRLFKKCYKLMLEANDALQKDDFGKAKNLYLKTRELYIKLEYHEKKEIYNALNALYDLLKK